MSNKLQALQEAGAAAYDIHQLVKDRIKPGLNLLEIEALIATEIASRDMVPAFKGFNGYPATSCLSVNSAAVHGIPYHYQLKLGDVIGVDLGISNHGWIVDTAWTHAVGPVSNEVNRLLEVTAEALKSGISQAKPGRKVGDISNAIQQTVENAGFFVVRELTGHGVGRTLQEPPTIPNHGRPSTGALIKPGMVLAIEPITALKSVRLTVDEDKWTVRANPDVATAHFEHTIMVTDTEPIVLTDKPNLE